MSNIKEFNVYLNTLRQKGNLAYEYNPLYNYQTDEDLYIINNKFIVPKGKAVNEDNGEILTSRYVAELNKTLWIDKRGRVIEDSRVLTCENGSPWASAGSLIDLDTDKLNFDLEHPVDIEILPSYDGSVNLIINDDKNIPRLINSRFSVREKNTYEIVDRIGENDTNIYNSKTFDKDTSLYFQYEYNPNISYLGFVKGILPVGLYCFYFTYCDSDNNESDFIAESGLIPAFIGNDLDPLSMDGGIKNQSSNKGIWLKLSNLDKSYNYLKIYYVRYFADYNQNRVHECKKIFKKFPINSSTAYIQITGYEAAEELDANILNISRFNPKSVLTQALCLNMLFFGNIVKNSDNYRELSDLALRIIPELLCESIDIVDNLYLSDSGDYGYYNSLNIYNKTGYFNKEYYRFGVVFIYLNGTLSNVYNTLGGMLEEDNKLNLSGNIYDQDGAILVRNYVKVDDKGWVKYDDKYEVAGKYVNARGVCLFNYTLDYKDENIFSVKFRVPAEVSKCLKNDLGIRGLFFVRQKCIPNIIALCMLLNMDETLEAPILESGQGNDKKYYTECFVNKELLLYLSYNPRLYEYNSNSPYISKVAYAGICPDFLLNQPYYNQIFNGGSFRLEKITYGSNSYLLKNNRFYEEQLKKDTTKYRPGTQNLLRKVSICSVTDDVDTVAIQNKVYRLLIGEAEEAFRFKYAEIDNGSYKAGDEDFDKINKASNIVRGKYSPYLAIYSKQGQLETGCLYNIYYDSSVSIDLEYQNRMDSSEPFYSISDRYNLVTSDLQYVCWRGDCYVNQFTYRLNRNFNDPSLPNNDEVIQYNTWKDHYKADNPEEWENISRSDVNAIQIGSWITFKLRSSMNYALRSVDHSYVSEEALMGTPRSFYPRNHLLLMGENKIPDSYLFNDAYRASLGFKCYYTIQDVNYVKDTFSNRIQYSAISIQDSFKNNYRYSLSTYFRDYSQEYGSITKLIESNNNLVVIFEHGIGIAAVNERVLAGDGDGGNVFINSKNVLPETLYIVSDNYGTLWGESVVKSESGYIYGVDTVAKKIWRLVGKDLEIISDLKVNKFLIDNITLGERELYPIIGLKNVKTHYNNNKKDIMFTFYDDIYKDEEKVWNLCYNELLNEFITFYSWVPSYSANIDTQFFTFNRNTSKLLTLLAKSNYSIPENTGILADNPVCKVYRYSHNNAVSKITLPKLYYVTKNKVNSVTYTKVNEFGHTEEYHTESVDLKEKNGRYEFSEVKFRIERDHWGNSDFIELDEDKTLLKIHSTNLYLALYNRFTNQKVILLEVTPYLREDNVNTGTFTIENFKTETVALTLEEIVENPLLTYENKKKGGLTTDFYLHGLAGIFNVTENVYPTYWYGEYHPFEFEFVVNDKIALLKIFTDLLLISNKAEPESFHFEIEGDNYEFSSDKRTMYFRLEATKNLYQNLGSNILYNRYYTDVVAKPYSYEQYYRTERCDYDKLDKVYPVEESELRLVRQVKSTIFPLYYDRVDTFNEIYHLYHLMKSSDGVYDFLNLSGSEISWNRDLNLFNIVTHIKNSPINLVGRLRGNSYYKEGTWNIQIPSINFVLKNETDLDWVNVSKYNEFKNGLNESGPLKNKNLKIPPIVINSQYVPNDIDTEKAVITFDRIPNIYTGHIDNVSEKLIFSRLANYIFDYGNEWTARKETKIRDKWMKIRIRYSGKNLAIIHSIATLYNISYS